jgi:hypothetical protein
MVIVGVATWMRVEYLSAAQAGIIAMSQNIPAAYEGRARAIAMLAAVAASAR